MVVNIIDKNLVESDAPVIMHQTNCCKGFGSGVAKAIRDKWSIVAEKHMLACDVNESMNFPTSTLLGKIQPVTVEPGKIVINLYAQDKFGYDGAMYTSYDALDKCLKKVKDYCENYSLKKVAMPYGMSSVRGGADWDVVLAMVKSAFKNTDIEIEICRYNP